MKQKIDHILLIQEQDLAFMSIFSVIEIEGHMLDKHKNIDFKINCDSYDLSSKANNSTQNIIIFSKQSRMENVSKKSIIKSV